MTANHAFSPSKVSSDGYGHVSARCDDEPGQYYIGDATAPANVRAKNVFRWQLDNEPAGHTRPTYGERFIHGQIYQARSDVHAIVHCRCAGTDSVWGSGRSAAPHLPHGGVSG